MDPFRGFAHYPTATIKADTRVFLVAGADAAAYAKLALHPLFSYAAKVLPAQAVVEALVACLTGADPVIQDLAMQDLAMQDLATRTGLELGGTMLAVSILAKMGLVRMRSADG
jgi:hypothetical protein